jgi:hypothetical protein
MEAGVIRVGIQSRALAGHMYVVSDDGTVMAESQGWDLREWTLVFVEGEEGWRVSSFGG